MFQKPSLRFDELKVKKKPPKPKRKSLTENKKTKKLAVKGKRFM